MASRGWDACCWRGGPAIFLAVACGLAAAAAAAATVVLRWRRADRVGRQQLKWFLAVLPIAAVSLIAGFFASGGPVNVILGALAGALLPVAIGIAVLRYRLYEIDLLLSRAVLYGLLTAGVGRGLPGRGGGVHIGLLTADPPLPYAQISTRLEMPVGSIGPTRSRCLDRMRRYPALAALIDTTSLSPRPVMDCS